MHPEPSSEKRITCGGNQCPDSMHHFPNPDTGKKIKAILRFFLIDLLNLSVDEMHPEPSSEERISCGGNQCPNSTFRFPLYISAIIIANCKLHRRVHILFKSLSSEPRYEKTGFLHMRKQRRRSASR